MKATNTKRELGQHGLQHRYEKSFADRLHRPHHLPLRHLVHRVDVIHPLDPVLVPLMHRVDADVSGASPRLRFPPLADGHRRRPRHPILDVPLAVRSTPPQPVQVRYRDPRQALVSRVMEVVAGPLEQLLRRRPAQGLVGLVHARQQGDVLPRIPPREPAPPVGLRFHLFTPHVHRDQPRRLRPAQSSHLLHVPPHHSPLAALQFFIPLLP